MTLLPYAFNSPAYWSDGSATERSDGRVDITYTRPNGNTGMLMVFQRESDCAGTTSVVQFDAPFGSQGSFGPWTHPVPYTEKGVSASDPLRFARWFVAGGGNPPVWAGWTPLIGATIPIADIPTYWHEVFVYGTYSPGDDNPTLPITSFIARPASAIRLDMRVSLDGGAP